MDTNKMREQFEAYARKKNIDVSVVIMCACHPQRFARYADREVQDKWEIWQASREAVVVHMPNRASEAYHEEFDDVEGGSFNEAAYIRDVRKAIEAEGLKVVA